MKRCGTESKLGSCSDVSRAGVAQGLISAAIIARENIRLDSRSIPEYKMQA